MILNNEFGSWGHFWVSFLYEYSSKSLQTPTCTLNIGFGTAVPVTNNYAAEAITLYLETDHPLIAMFDVDVFIGSLVGGDIAFCSSFLVNALLAFASVSIASRWMRYLILQTNQIATLLFQETRCGRDQFQVRKRSRNALEGGGKNRLYYDTDRAHVFVPVAPLPCK